MERGRETEAEIQRMRVIEREGMERKRDICREFDMAR